MAAECEVLSEIEVLQSIYLDELLVCGREDGGWEVSLVLYPSTAEDSVSQFVRLTLTLTLDQQYPSSPPVISIQNPRGLSDDKLRSVQRCLQLEAQSCPGSPVLYQLIEKAKEFLTESNIPHGNCVICLFGFKEGETFTKTRCYHYFHCHCLGRYVRHSEGELRRREEELQEDKTRERPDEQELRVVCPVCREALTYDVDQLLSSPEPHLPQMDEAAMASAFQQKWREVEQLWERQRSNGGIIDPEVESNRFLIHVHQPPPVAENGHLDADVSPVPCDEGGVRAARSAPGLSQCRGGPGQRRQNQARGPRRGGRSSRPHHRRAAPPTEHLDKLSLSSRCSAGPAGDVVQPAPAEPERQSQTGGDAERRRAPESSDAQLGPECPGDAAESAGHLGRRRGPHRYAPHTGPPHTGPPHCHWKGRAPRSGEGGSNLYGRGRGGPRHARGLQHKLEEREEVR